MFLIVVMEVQTIEKKPVVGKQTVTATEETSAVAERTKEVIILVTTSGITRK